MTSMEIVLIALYIPCVIMMIRWRRCKVRWRRVANGLAEEARFLCRRITELERQLEEGSGSDVQS
jgi:hypothetical protein